MTYRFIQLASGAYDLHLDGEVMGSVVRTGERSNNTFWTAELLEDLPPSQRPAPLRRLNKPFLPWRLSVSGSERVS